MKSVYLTLLTLNSRSMLGVLVKIVSFFCPRLSPAAALSPPSVTVSANEQSEATDASVGGLARDSTSAAAVGRVPDEVSCRASWSVLLDRVFSKLRCSRAWVSSCSACECSMPPTLTSESAESGDCER